jgi:2-polyprenyl-3-methyl-5-hydroxy-6-metoxy-1,4-benzoquinol methylase
MNDLVDNPVFEIALAYQKTAALVAAVKIDLFTTIGASMRTADDLATQTGASSRGIRILCDALVTIDLLRKEDDRYGLAPSSRVFLDDASPFSMGSIVDFVAAPEMLNMFMADPSSYVRRGGSMGLSNLAPDNPIWVRFARSMAPFAATTARLVGSYVANLPDLPTTVLDIAAGHGLYGIEIAKALHDAQITAIDWSSVLAVAVSNAANAGVTDRYRALHGDALTIDWGHDFDLILLPNFLHHFDFTTCTNLLRKVKASLSFGGAAIGIDFVPNEDRVSPKLPAMFAFWMLATTPGGDAYTVNELDQMAKAAGFSGVTTRALAPTPETLIIFDN